MTLDLSRLEELHKAATTGPFSGPGYRAWSEYIADALPAIPQLIEEIKRLTSENADLAAEALSYRTQRDEVKGASLRGAVRQNAEIERLRAALEQIADEPNQMGPVADEVVYEYGLKAWDIARQALGEKTKMLVQLKKIWDEFQFENWAAVLDASMDAGKQLTKENIRLRDAINAVANHWCGMDHDHVGGDLNALQEQVLYVRNYLQGVLGENAGSKTNEVQCEKSEP